MPPDSPASGIDMATSLRVDGDKFLRHVANSLLPRSSNQGENLGLAGSGKIKVMKIDPKQHGTGGALVEEDPVRYINVRPPQCGPNVLCPGLSRRDEGDHGVADGPHHARRVRYHGVQVMCRGYVSVVVRKPCDDGIEMVIRSKYTIRVLMWTVGRYCLRPRLRGSRAPAARYGLGIQDQRWLQVAVPQMRNYRFDLNLEPTSSGMMLGETKV